MNITILILAAGCGRRFGSDKRLALLANDRPLLICSVSNALASGLPVLVCLRPGDEGLALQLRALGASTLLCPDAHLGMAHTLAAGIDHAEGADGVLVALGDMPDILPATFCRIAEVLRSGAICQAEWKGIPGHPVAFSRKHYPALKGLTGDRGARSILNKNREAVTRLPVDDPGILRDIDRPTDITN